MILGCGYLGYNLYGLLQDRFEVELWGIESPYTSRVPDQVMVSAFDPCEMAKQDLKGAVVIDAIGLIANNAKTDNEEETLEGILEPYRKLIGSLKQGGVKRFVYFSSGGTIYGNTDHPNKEDDPVAPMSLYARSKAVTEQLIRTSDIPYLILRLSNPYGGYQLAEKKQGVIPILIRRALLEEPFEMFVDPLSVRDYFYITDLAGAIVGLLEKDISDEIINIGSGTGTSLQEIITLVEEATGKKITIVTKPSEVPTVQSIILDISKIHGLTGYQPAITLKQGIQKETERIRKELNL